MNGKLNLNDKITITGKRRRKDGSFTRRCKKGNEDVFTVTKVIENGYDIKRENK